MKQRHGTIYSEMTNKGRCSTKYVRGARPIYCFRWVAEIKVHGKRYRCRSSNFIKVRRWLDDQIIRWADEPIYYRKQQQVKHGT
jgi:hypothetical protein